ncbi:MAG: hypothetical protein ACJ73D_12425 [Pyrinomonadaceae bacterium]
MRTRSKHDDRPALDIWARPEMQVTFRAEIMPDRTREERTYRIETVLPNARVTLHDFPGEYRETAFEGINFLREKAAKDQKS